MSSYVIPVFPAASRVPPRDALSARLAELTGRFAELSAELAAISSAVDSVSGKADKAPPSAAGNLASLDASGNLSDSGATPASIKAAAVAEVVANAPGTMDTLKEIADILGSAPESGTVMSRISALERGKADSSSLARVATSGSYDDLTGKPTIPAAVSVDPTLTTKGAAADAKAVGDALRSGFTEWVCDSISEGYKFVKCEWRTEDLGGEDGWHVIFTANGGGAQYDFYLVGLDEYATSFSGGSIPTIQISRHLITPTKTSQLTNDGDGSAPNTAFVLSNDTRLSDSRTPTAHHATHAANGSDPLAPADIGAAAASDLPYRLVEPGKWEFSGLQDGMEVVSDMSFVETSGDTYYWQVFISLDGGQLEFASEEFSDISHANDLSVVLTSIGGYTVSATRPSLPGHLLDRAGNRVVVTGDTTLTLPEANPGYLRDFLVRLEISGSTVPTITFAAPTGETLTYETDGDEFPVPDEAGTWSYSFTENCVAHKFAVSLKKVNEVAQGGS